MQPSEIQQEILDFLKRSPSGEVAGQIAEKLGLAKTTAQEHLAALSSAGMVYYKDERGLIGRPKRKYFLSDSDFNEFKTQYSWLSSLLLKELSQSLTPEQLTALLSRIAHQLVKDLNLEAVDTKDRLQKIAGIMNDLGYNVSFKRSENVEETIIEAKSCVYHKVAVQHPALCEFDVKLLEKVSEKSVKLQCCIARGGKVCRFSLV